MNDSELSDVLAVIQQRTGLSFRSDQRQSIQRTLSLLMQRLGITRSADFIAEIQKNAKIYDELVDEITVGETYFFREPKQFDFIRHQIIPELRSRRGDSTILRAWSAACASGEEAYSLAILCQQEKQHLDVLGTDLSVESIAKARRASYREWSFRGGAMSQVANHLMQTHASKHSECYELSKQVRRHVRFQILNLATDQYPNPSVGIGNFDLILCRNVLIYFRRETIDAIASRLYECLVPGGWLITASGDPSLIHASNFTPVTTPYGTFYQRPNVKTAAQLSTTGGTQPASRTSVRSPAAKSQAPAAEPAKSADTPASPSPPQTPMHTRVMAEARQSLAAGDYAAAVRLTENHLQHPDACVVHVRSQAHLDAAAALQTCSQALISHPLATELHYLRARLLMDANELDEAARTIGRALFLDRSDVMSQFLAGSIQFGRGQWKVAYRHFETVLKLCNQQDPQALIPFSKQNTAAVTAAAAESQMTKIRALLAKTP
ncbi:CheR family methyltransferase [Novipirellula maiorica]|uniref:CheR family methyltransferase n=1 Tax=Novipirellula maiorica TaxID=1265734 RepID=UPI00034AD2F1|nr:CheR family methyltransferase [Rhodopirellula maiorica]